MKPWQQEFRNKLISPQKAAELVKDNMLIDIGLLNANPWLIIEHLAERTLELNNVTLYASRAARWTKIFDLDPMANHIKVADWFYDPAWRAAVNAGRTDNITMRYVEEPTLYRNYINKKGLDIAFVAATPPDNHGYFNFSTMNSFLKAMCQAAKMVVIEVNETLPWVYGGFDEVIHISEVDYVVQGDAQKYPILAVPKIIASDVERAMAEKIITLLRDGDVLQLGVGGLPSAVAEYIAVSGIKDLSVHTELLGDGYWTLFEKGLITNKKKIFPGKSVFNFATGSRELYDWMDHNPSLATCPVDYTNNPHIIAQHDNMVSINAGLQVDLTGQVSAESIGFRQISGTGGQLDFHEGAFWSKGGRAIISIRSSFVDKQGKLHSNIVLDFPPGSIITTPRTVTQYIVTEFGITDLKGKTNAERAKSLIAIAHPDFREELERKAREVNIIPKGWF